LIRIKLFVLQSSEGKGEKEQKKGGRSCDSSPEIGFVILIIFHFEKREKEERE